MFIRPFHSFNSVYQLLDSICSKIDNLQKFSSPAKSVQESNNKKLENELSGLRQRIHTLESEKSEFTYNTQKLKSDYEMKIAILESENDFLQQNVDKIKRQVSNAMRDNSQKVYLDKIARRNDEIHISNVANNESFELVSHKSKIPSKISVHDVVSSQSANVSSSPVIIDKEKSSRVVTDKEKKDVLLVGTSIVRYIDPKILSKDYDISKSSSYSLEETAKVIDNANSPPVVVIFHSMTNNLKTEDPSSCVQKLNDIVDRVVQKWPSTHVMISMETPRADQTDLNNKVLVANGLIRSIFYKKRQCISY